MTSANSREASLKAIPLELLAPAKNLACGIAAIDHGADAVYIGAARYGARAAAGNSTADIAELCRYAHQYGAKVYVTVNTIIYDNELDDTHQLLNDLADANVDAILVQDMGLLNASHSSPHASLTFHASTQTDNRTAEKVAWLRDAGFRRVVLARELTIDEIRAIHQAVPDVELEVFVHGALCVSYSGQCYASQHCFGRSANRGECAQFCRMQFDLVDADGHELIHQRHLLSLRDLNQSRNLEALAEAGATSFKIEGRLKDVDYVKNVTAAYSQLLDQLVARHHGRYRRASLGRCTYTFKPDLERTFNRGYTTYFAHGRQANMASFDTPKAMGQYVGTVKEVRRDSIVVAGTAAFANGDGLCFLDDNHTLVGFRVNRSEGNRLFPQHLPAGLHRGQRLYRNSDQAFERLLARPSAERKIPVRMALDTTPDGFRLTLTVVDNPMNGGEGQGTSITIALPHQHADKPQRENIIRQLSKLGNTPYKCVGVDLPDDFNYFIPSSILADMRRKVAEAAEGMAAANSSLFTLHSSLLAAANSSLFTLHSSLYTLNIANHAACQFYGVDAPTAFELHEPADAMIMQCRYCLRHELGYCVKNGGQQPYWREPLKLRLADGRTFSLVFDCRHCQMNIEK